MHSTRNGADLPKFDPMTIIITIIVARDVTSARRSPRAIRRMGVAVTSSPRAGFSFRKEVRCVVTSLFRAGPVVGGRKGRGLEAEVEGVA